MVSAAVTATVFLYVPAVTFALLPHSHTHTCGKEDMYVPVPGTEGKLSTNNIHKGTLYLRKAETVTLTLTVKVSEQ